MIFKCFWKFEIVTDLLCRSKGHPFPRLRRVKTKNIGNGINTPTGYIMAPKSGTYFLELLFWTRPFSTIIRDKTGNASLCQGGSRREQHGDRSRLTFHSTKRLWRWKSTMSSRCRFITYLSTNESVLYANERAPHFTQFMGWMLQEDFSYSQWSSGK